MVSQKEIVWSPSHVCEKLPLRPWSLEMNSQNHRKHPEENVYSLPLLPSPPQFLNNSGFGTRKLEKGQRLLKEKHRWLSDGLTLSYLGSPMQSQHLRGHIFEMPTRATGGPRNSYFLLPLSNWNFFLLSLK